MSLPQEIEGAAVRRLGRYLLFGELASGGIGSVHLATASAVGGFKKVVAIKRLHPQFRKDRAFTAEFLEEARLSARIAHANVVQTLDAVEASGEVFLVMEYVHGEALHRLLRRAAAGAERVPVAIGTSIIAGVLQGLAAAHAMCDANGQSLGLVHRDVSPQNIIVGADGTARLLDFGIARALGKSSVTPEGVVKGKVAYMAPEQLGGESLTARADLYSCSVVLWELLTGERLFAGDSEGATLGRVLHYSVPPPSELRPEIPVALNRVVLRGLARNPELRYGSAAAMAAALEAALPIASAATVAAWVRRLAADSLARRAEACAACERANEETLPKPRPQRRAASAVGLTLVAALFLVGAGAVAYRVRRATPVESIGVGSPGSAGGSARAVASMAPLVESASAGASLLPSASGAPQPPFAPSSSASAVVRTTRGSNDCNPPWILDSEGRKRFKRQCL
jgi:serine/threonine-protein kinase